MQLGRLIQGIMRGGARRGPRVTTGASSRMAGSRRMPNVKSTRTQSQRTGKAPTSTTPPKTGGGGLLGGIPRLAGSILQGPIGTGLTITGLGVAVPGMIQDFSRGVKRDILSAGPQDGSDFTPNAFQRFVTGMDADDYRKQYDKENLEALLKRGEVSERIAMGAAAPVEGEDFAQYIGRTNPQYKRLLEADEDRKATAAGRRAFNDPTAQYNRAMAQSTLDREYGLLKRQMEAGIRESEGKLDLQEMQLLNARQDAQQQMALLQYQEANRANEANFRNRVELMQGLSALSMGLFS